MIFTPGLPRFTLSNGVVFGFWYENDSEGIWLVYQMPGEPELRSGGLFFQLGAVYINTTGGGPAPYLVMCLLKINKKIRELFPALFGAAPAPEVFVPPEIERLGSESVFFIKWLSEKAIVGDQIV